MVRVCWVRNCTNRSDKGVKRTWCSIPTVRTTQGEETRKLSDERRKLWLSNIGRKDVPTKHSLVCSDHFVSGRSSDLYDKSNPDWAPTLKLGKRDDDIVTADKGAQKTKRYSQTVNRKEQKERLELAKALLELARPPQCFNGVNVREEDHC